MLRDHVLWMFRSDTILLDTIPRYDTILPMKTCQHCQSEFTPKNPKGRFCTTRCRIAANRGSKPKLKVEKKWKLKVDRKVKLVEPVRAVEVARPVQSMAALILSKLSAKIPSSPIYRPRSVAL